MNPNDKIRRLMLQYFYDRNANATSAMGKKGAAVKIMDVRKELKEKHDLSVKEVVSNLNYLIDNDWVKTIEVEKEIRVRGGTLPQKTTWYQIAAKGVDRIEGGSQFEPKSRYEGINVTAIGNSVVTLGDGNVVNVDYRELHTLLDDLKGTVTASTKVPDPQKLEIIADVESLKDQLAKPKPKANVVKAIWSDVVEKAATIDGAAGLVGRIAALVSGFFGG